MMNTATITAGQAARAMGLDEKGMMALLSESGVQTEGGLLTGADTEALLSFLEGRQEDSRRKAQENLERLGLEQDAICTVRDVLEKVVTDYAILPAKPNMDEVKRALTLLENHAIIQRIDGKFNQSSCKFAILPTVLAAVSGEKLNAVVSVLRKEDADEEAEEDPAD